MVKNINLNVNFKSDKTIYLRNVNDRQILMCEFENTLYVNGNTTKIIHNYSSNTNDPRIISNIKPEIGKKRPVIILKANKNLKTVLVIPLTTKKDNSMENKVYVPKSKLPGILSEKDSWILCHLLTTVSIKRLTGVYQSNNSKKLVPLKESMLDKTIFDQVKQTTKKFQNL